MDESIYFPRDFFQEPIDLHDFVNHRPIYYYYFNVKPKFTIWLNKMFLDNFDAIGDLRLIVVCDK